MNCVCIYVYVSSCLFSFPEPVPVKFPIDQTPSNVSMESLRKHGVKDEVPIYMHFFAMELYDTFNALNDGETFSYRLNGVDVSVTSASINNLFERYKSICNLNSSKVVRHVGVLCPAANVQKLESTQTALLTAELDRFFYSNDPQCNFTCVHQLPVYFRKAGQPECPDFYIVRLHEGLPDLPVLVSDYKISNYVVARKETIAYATRVMEKTKQYFGVFLGLPITSFKATLLLCVGLNAQMLVIDMFKEPLILTEKQMFKKFFALVYGAVTALVKRPIYGDANVIPILHPPERCFPLIASGVQRVFFNDGMVYKLYDREDDRISPNIDVIQCIAKNYLPDVKLVNLNENKRFQCLQYRFLNGSSTPKSPQQFLTLMSALKKLHSAGYVHGDIRSSNLIFDSIDDKKARIIDFDLAGTEGSLYPSTYNLKVPERRIKVRGFGCDLQREKADDVHAIKVIFENNYKVSLELAKDASLDDVVEAVKKFHKML